MAENKTTTDTAAKPRRAVPKWLCLAVRSEKRGDAIHHVYEFPTVRITRTSEQAAAAYGKMLDDQAVKRDGIAVWPLRLAEGKTYTEVPTTMLIESSELPPPLNDDA